MGSVFLYEYDNLKNNEKEIIKVASIIGNKFSILILKNIFKNKDLENILNILINKSIIKNDGGRFYSFTNTLLRDAIYNTILQKHIIIYHYKIAKIYEDILKTNNYTKLGLKKEYLFGIIGYHYERANKYKKAVKYILLAANYYRDMYFNTEALYYYNILLKYANKKQKKNVLINIVDILIALGKIDSAINNANILKNTFNDKKYIALALHKLSLIYGTYKSQYKLALKNAFYSLKLYENINDRKGMADIYGIIGGIYQALNENKKAIEFLNKSILIAKKIKYSFRLMISMYYIAFTYYNTSEYKNALSIINKMEEQIELYNDYENMARVKQLKAWIYNVQGKLNEAEENIINAIEIATLINNKPLLISLVSDKAALEKNKGDFNNAIKLYKECINMEKENNLFSNIDVYYNNIGMMYYFMKKYKNTIDYFIKALNFAEKINDYKRIGIYSGNIGELYMYSGNLKEGIKYLKKAIKYEKKANYVRGIGLNSLYLGNAYKYDNDYSNALKFYNKAIKYLNNSDKNKIVNVLFEKIDLYIRKNNKLYAIKLIKKCLKESENIDQLIFIRTKILYMYLKNDYKKLLNLSKQYENIVILADIYFYLFLLLKTNKLKKIAIKTNNRMIKQHSDYLYIYRKDILTNN